MYNNWDYFFFVRGFDCIFGYGIFDFIYDVLLENNLCMFRYE